MPQSQSGTPSVGWIKFLAIVTAWLTIILVALEPVLKSNTHSYADNGAIAKSSPYASASSDSSPPPPIVSPFLLSTRQRQNDMNGRSGLGVQAVEHKWH